MRIWVDGYEANVSQRLGSSQVAFELIKNLEKIDKKNDYTILLSSKPLDDLPKLNIEEKVIFTGFVETEHLPYLLSGAKAFVLPSLYEGFGIPVVEAMACGTPVIVSNVSSLPEVAGSAGLFVDPKSVTQIEQAIRTISSDKKLNAKLSKASIKQAKKFSWRKMARIVLKVFEQEGKK